MITTLLIRLLIAHLLTDFVFQPKAWVDDRRKRKIRSRKLFWHVCLTTLFAYLFSGLYDCWWLPLVIFATHYIIDGIKTFLPDNLLIFIVDQTLHILVIIIIWLIADRQWEPIKAGFYAIINDKNIWLVVLGYVLVTWPLGIFIGIATAKWRKNLAPQANLADAGKWIGICERAMILTFVLTQQYTAIGFLITAKSILRFGDKDHDAERKTEYILVGTLLSFASSALLGVLIALAIGN